MTHSTCEPKPERPWLRISCIGFAAFALTSCRSGKESTEEKPRFVRTLSVAGGGAQGERTFSGIAEAGTVSNLSFKVAGLVKERPVEVGQAVKKGELIALLDDTDYRLKLKQAQASYTRARAQERSMEVSYQRMRKLYENRSISAQELDTSRATAETSKAQAAAEAQAVNMAQTQLSYTRLTAPADGEIASTRVDINENVDAGQVVAVLNSGELPKVSFDVPRA